MLYEPLKPYVEKQIETREKALSIGDYGNDNTLKYANSKAPWLRLTSTVNFTDSNNNPNYDNLIKLGIDKSKLINDELAKCSVLQGGALQNNTLSKGLNSDFSSAYGWGGIKSRGYVPMPGITNASLVYYNEGSVSKSTIDIICHSPEQMAIIDILYLRPGFNLLLEFGWSTYLDNNGSLKNWKDYDHPISKKILGGKYSNNWEIYEALEEERNNHSGNYEGVFGIISNYNWSFLPNGKYQCTVTLSGPGSLIESLKINVPTDKNIEDNLESQSSEESFFKPTDLRNKLNKIIKQTNNNGLYDINFKDFPNLNNTIIKIPRLKIPKALLKIKSTNSIDSEENTFYISFGALLAYIQKYYLIYNKNIHPLTSFNINFEKITEDTNNFISRIPGTFSSNPNKALVKYDNITSTTYNLPEYELTTTLNKGLPFIDNTNILRGRLTEVYININFIKDILNEFNEENGKISILDFLKNVIGGIQDSLGNVNNISIKEDINTGLISFVDDNDLNIIDSKDQNLYKINLYGVTPTKGSIVKNLSLNSNMSNDWFSQITIANTISNNKSSVDATGFSNHNKGLKDRIIPTKIENYKNAEEESNDSRIKKLLANIIKPMQTVYRDQNFTNEGDSISILSTTTKTLFPLLKQILITNKNSYSPILPFKLSIDLEGISGIKLFSMFELDTKILPIYYKDKTILSIVTSLEHNISDKEWTTKLNVQYAPLFPTGTGAISPPTPQPLNTVAFESNQTPFEVQTTTNWVNNLFTLPPTFSSNKNSNEKKKIFQEIYTKFWGENDSNPGLCGSYTYSLGFYVAKAFISYETSQTLSPYNLREGNDRYAKSNNIKDDLINLGYTHYIRGYLTKEELINTLEGDRNKNFFDYGDIVRYWCIDGDQNENHVKYGHVQMYVGDIDKGDSKGNWTTSTKDNYFSNGGGITQGQFIYNTPIGNQWVLEYFKAPSLNRPFGALPFLPTP